MLFIGLAFCAPKTFAQTLPTPETYKSMADIDRDYIPAQKTTHDVYSASEQSYSLEPQADGSVVLSAFITDESQPEVIPATFVPVDRVYQLKLFATGVMLIAGGLIGLVSVRDKKISYKIC